MFQVPDLGSFTTGHNQLAKTAIEAGEGSLPVTQEENETRFCEHIAFSLPQKVFPFDLIQTSII